MLKKEREVCKEKKSSGREQRKKKERLRHLNFGGDFPRGFE